MRNSYYKVPAKHYFLDYKIYYLIIFVLLLLFCGTLYHRISHFDDAWCTEQSYWLLKDGIVRSELFAGYQQWGKQLYVFHKAFVYVQAGLLYFLGFSVWGARATTLLFTVVCLLLLLAYFRSSREHQLLATLLYVGCGTLWLFGVDNRPETMVVSFGFASFLVLQKKPPSAGYLLAAGALAGGAALTHLNGLIYVVAGTLWLLPRSGWRAALLFGAAGSIVTGVYFLDAIIDHQLPLLFYQFNHYPANVNNTSLSLKLHLMARYDRMFMHSEGETPLTILTVLTLIITHWGRPIRQLFTPTFQYVTWIVVLFWFLTKSDNAYYFILFVPFFVVIATENMLSPNLSKVKYQLLVALLVLYPLGSIARTYTLIKENYTYPNALAENTVLATYMPQKGANVIAPISFFFGQMDNYRVRGLTYYAYVNEERYNKQLRITDFFQLAARDSVRYIISDLRTFNDVYPIPPDAPARIGGYQKVFQDAWHSVYAWQPRTLARRVTSK